MGDRFDSPWSSQSFDQAQFDALTRYHNQGPFYVESAVEVALEEEQ